MPFSCILRYVYYIVYNKDEMSINTKQKTLLILPLVFLCACHGEKEPPQQFKITITGTNIIEQYDFFYENSQKDIYVDVQTELGYMPDQRTIQLDDSDAAEVRYISKRTLQIRPLKNQNFVVTLATTEAIYDIFTSGEKIEFYEDEERTRLLNHIKIDYGKDLIFYMVADYTSPENYYICPNALDIRINYGLVPLLLNEDYKIESITGEFANIEKKVTIYKKAITGDISISGDATEVNAYHIVLPYFFGLEKPSEEKTYFMKNAEGKVEFKALNSNDLLTAENIYVNFTPDNPRAWISPADSEFKSYGQFDQSKLILTINPNVVDDDINTIQVIARTKDFPTLEPLSPEEISRICEYDFETYVFDIGDTKTITTNDGNTNKIRIIDFNHDELADGSHKKASITFEFIDALDFRSAWDENNNHDYTKSLINKKLQENGEIYNLIPKPLIQAMKMVNKKFDRYDDNLEEWKPGNYSTKMFLFTMEEISGNYSDVTYQYYINSTSDKRSKARADTKHTGAMYWLRNPAKETALDPNEKVYYVHRSGDFYEDFVQVFQRDIVPVFCI